MSTNVLQTKKVLSVLLAALLPLMASAQTKVEIGGIWYNLDSKVKQAEVTFRGDSPSEYYEYYGSVTIPAVVAYGGMNYSVTRIGDQAFEYCKLTSISIPESVTSIGVYAFKKCDNLTTITVADKNTIYDSRNDCNAIIETNSNTLIIGCSATIIPESVTVIGYNAFCNCSSLTHIIIPKGVISIEEYAFVGCEGLTSIIISEGVKSIGKGAFIDCRSLTTITIPKGVTGIEENAFLRCFSLVNITIPEGVTNIGEYAFYNCFSLVDITIPESVTSIGSSAFRHCNSLTAITLPKGLTNIGYGAFRDCSAITTITSKAAIPPIASGYTFGGVDKSIPVYIPKESATAYQSAKYWNEFTNFIEVDFLEKCGTPSICYIDGKLILTCNTEEARIITTVTNGDDEVHEEKEFTLIPTYTITAYATKENYENSDEVSLTLCWIPCTEEHKSEETGILTIPSKPVLISTQGGTITLSGLAADTEVAAYDTAGTQLATTMTTAGTATLTTNLTTGDIAIVKIGDYSIKVVIR